MGWLDSLTGGGSEGKTPPFTIPEPLQEYLNLLQEQVPSLPPQIQETYESFTSTQLAYAGAACGVSFFMGLRVGRIRPVWRAYRDVTEISNSAIGPDSPFLQGRAVSISDGDTIRFWHTPTMFSAKSPPKDARISQVALPIRICTIDTPETAKFGKSGQPFGVDAKDYLSGLLENRNIQVQILTKDQYGRAVAQVRTGVWPFYKYADQKMLQAGLAEVYRGGGAVYGDKGLVAYSAMETKAQGKKRGMWSQGDKRESAAEYKARTSLGD
jgi:micrococcal nuclease